MNDAVMKRLIMENLPGTDKGEASLIYMRIAVQQDMKSIGKVYDEAQFLRCLNQLHDAQSLFLFTNGWVKPTQSGLIGFNLT
tara:strand:- start:349 stop:594 length:246 start_codon:yes stop_codon:yes gene_type:complete